MEIFVTVTYQASRRGGSSSHASSSRAGGKVLTVPQNRINKASAGRGRKRAKTADVVEVEPLTYHESKSELEPEPVPELLPEQPKRIELNGQWYHKVADLAGQRPRLS